MAANEGKILPLPPQAAMTEAPHIAVESPGDGKLRQIGFAQAVDDVVNLRGSGYADTILPDQTDHANMVLKTDGTTADWAYVQAMRLYAKNDSGVTLTRGQAVYVNGAAGTNILITRAQANTEATSSKTIGLVETESVAPNGFCWVVTEGILYNVNTGTGNDGDVVWLSPSTPGGLVYGIGSKPSAPDHMVFIGYVVRANANVGEIYVKPQNGFELKEIHDVQITTTPSNGQVLAYESSSALWKPTTISGGGGGSGDVTGPSSSTDNAIARFDLATGKIIQNSVVTVDDTGSISGATQVNASTGFVGPRLYAFPNATTTTSAIRIYEDYVNGNHYVELKVPTSITVNKTFIIPATDGTNGEFLKTNGSGNLSFADSVTSVSGTSPVSSSGGGTPTISLATAYGDTANPYGSKTANFVLAAPNGAAGVPTFRAVVAADIPTLNQNTTGSAAKLTTARNINGVGFDGSADITVPAAAGTLTGSSLAAGVTGSSLTSVGTITSGTWNGAAIGDAYISSAATWNAKQAAITFGTGVQAALGVNVGSAGSPVVNGGVLGTPTSGTLTNCTVATAAAASNGTTLASTAFVQSALASRSYSNVFNA